MLLKRLEINGFKSFANKTVFEFDTGIVAVVGPNGSGKSNIIDAFRWLLGERDAKNLRGGKGEDLIFAGTPKKPRMSQASVSIVLDNASGALPIDFHEVVITRKISRSGTSEYLINDAPVRLKDIIDFFSKIRLGSKGLSIIGQGAGDLFVKASAQDRMMMVQEILGLREYELKKFEAQRKLKNARTNMEKIQAMIQEVLPRLRMLKRQTAKWERRWDIEKKLKDLELTFFPFRIKQLFEAKQKALAPVPEIDQKLSTLHRELDQAQQALEVIEQDSASSIKIEEIQKEKRALFDEKSSKERELFRVEARLEQIEEYVTQESFSFDQAKTTLGKVDDLIKKKEDALTLEHAREIIGQIKKLLKELFSSSRGEEAKEKNQLQEKRKQFTQQIQSIEEKIKSYEVQEQKLSAGMQEFSERFKEAFGRVEELKSKIQNLEEQKKRISFEEEKIAYRLEDVVREINSAGGNADECIKTAQSDSFHITMSEEDLAQAERTILKLRGELASIGEIDETLVKESQEVESHYEFLKQESEDLQSASENLQQLISELNQKISEEFKESFKKVNEAFHTYFRLMFGGGSAKMKVIKKEVQQAEERDLEENEEVFEDLREKTEKGEQLHGIDIEVSIPQKKITSLDMLSGGERSLTSLAVIFALISISPPPFLVLDEADAALDEKNSRRFSELVRNFADHTQFIIVTHNRVTMEAADILYGVTMDDAGCSKILSLKLTDAQELTPGQ